MNSAGNAINNRGDATRATPYAVSSCLSAQFQSTAVRARVLALVAHGSNAANVVTWAHDLAQASGGLLICAQLIGPNADLEPDEAAALQGAQALAANLGAETVELRADDLCDELFRFAAQRRVTHIVVGRPRNVALTSFLREVLPSEFTDEDGEIRVVVVCEPATSTAGPRSAHVAPRH